MRKILFSTGVLVLSTFCTSAYAQFLVADTGAYSILTPMLEGVTATQANSADIAGSAAAIDATAEGINENTASAATSADAINKTTSAEYGMFKAPTDVTAIFPDPDPVNLVSLPPSVLQQMDNSAPVPSGSPSAAAILRDNAISSTSVPSEVGAVAGDEAVMANLGGNTIDNLTQIQNLLAALPPVTQLLSEEDFKQVATTAAFLQAQQIRATLYGAQQAALDGLVTNQTEAYKDEAADAATVGHTEAAAYFSAGAAAALVR